MSFKIVALACFLAVFSYQTPASRGDRNAGEIHQKDKKKDILEGEEKSSKGQRFRGLWSSRGKAKSCGFSVAEQPADPQAMVRD